MSSIVDTEQHKDCSDKEKGKSTVIIFHIFVSNLITHNLRKWSFRKSGTMGTLAIKAEIDINPGKILRVYTQNHAI